MEQPCPGLRLEQRLTLARPAACAVALKPAPGRRGSHRARNAARRPPGSALGRGAVRDRPAVLLWEVGARCLRLASSGSLGADGGPRNLAVGGVVGGDDFTPPWVTLAVATLMRSWAPMGRPGGHEGEELGVGEGDRVVVVDDGDDIGDVVDESLTVRVVGVVGEVGSDQELGDSADSGLVGATCATRSMVPRLSRRALSWTKVRVRSAETVLVVPQEANRAAPRTGVLPGRTHAG